MDLRHKDLVMSEPEVEFAETDAAQVLVSVWLPGMLAEAIAKMYRRNAN